MKYIIVLFVLLPFSAFNQDTLSKFSAGVSFCAERGHRILSSNSDLELLNKDFASLERSCFSYTCGISLGYALNERNMLQSGLTFSNRGYNIDSLTVASLLNLKMRFRYLEVPVSIVHSFLPEAKLHPVFSIGVFGGLLLNNHVSYENMIDSQTADYSNFQSLNTLNFGVLASLGFKTNLDPKHSFQLEGIFRQSLSSVSDTPMKRYLNAVGLNASVRRSF